MGRCDTNADQCVYEANDAACVDSDLCNGVETCSLDANGKGTCVDGTPVVCGNDASNLCDGVEACNPSNGSCEIVQPVLECDDVLFCNGAETCDPVQGCMSGTAPDCNAIGQCGSGSCNENLDRCDYVADDAACDNGNVCDGAETCTLRACVAAIAVIPSYVWCASSWPPLLTAV